ncbi:MAG: RecQ family ATP-dependent DNA helicase [Flammeovirgaceae bacterium]
MSQSPIIAGHNIIHHDIPILKQHGFSTILNGKKIIDTLYLSTLLFPNKPYHHLVKDYKLVSTERNNPLADSIQAQQLYEECVQQFSQLSATLQEVFALLLKQTDGFNGFFDHQPFQASIRHAELVDFIRKGDQKDKYCTYGTFHALIEESPITLAFAIALANANNQSIAPPWLNHKFPKVNEYLKQIRLQPCDHIDCTYCTANLNPTQALKKYFGYDSFRSFEYDDGMPLQEQVVRAGLEQQSFLAIFPTGGGKSLTFQLPALLQGDATKALTVVISPLQALMKDQVDVLEKRFDIVEAVAINGLLSPLERAQAIESVTEGGAHLLYLSPESLRSASLFRILLQRNIARFVIDEAHCFSSWGQDFRVDYLYIGEFISLLQEQKKLTHPIPVSCFTATAKPQVVDDICHYFQTKLGLQMEVFQANAQRKNLSYEVIEVKNEKEKYTRLLHLIEQTTNKPTIIYSNRTKQTEEISRKLKADGYQAVWYHGKLATETKKLHQNAFLSGEVNIIVATSAFGMGVDKDNVAYVIHYEISSSLENYTQEAGRAGRKADIDAKCYVLFNESDLSAHFQLHQLSKINFKDIYQLWRGVKKLTHSSMKVCKSAIELAKAAGWDADHELVENKVRAALALLEEQGYLQRKFNRPRVFADSILVKTAEEGRTKIRNSKLLDETYKEHALRIFSSISQRSKQDAQVDLLSERLGISKEATITTLNYLRKEKIIGDQRDLSVYIDHSQGKKGSEKRFRTVALLEKNFFKYFNHDKERIYLKEINHHLLEKELTSTIDDLKDLLRFWKKNGYLHFKKSSKEKYVYITKLKQDFQHLNQRLQGRQLVCLEIIEALHRRSKGRFIGKTSQELIEFSFIELMEEANDHLQLTVSKEIPLPLFQEALLYLHHIGSIELKDGFLIYYTPMEIERLIENNKIQFKQQDYEKLKSYYQHRTEQVHIVGEYAAKMLQNYQDALRFVNDYFTIPHQQFIAKYFSGDRKKEIQRSLTLSQFHRLIHALSPEQLQVILDNESQHSMIVAGPGSGKTHVLVNKIATLLQVEDLRSEQFLMLTFSRAAASEFKNRLHELIGALAYGVDIHTFHGYAFELLGKMGSLDEADQVIPRAIESIQRGEAPLNKVANKSMLIIDEFQDIGSKEHQFLHTILEEAEHIKSIIVGDDDQTIYEFRGADIQNFHQYAQQFKPNKHHLLTNYRSHANLVDLSNFFIKRLKRRLKDKPLVANTNKKGKIHIIEYQTNSPLYIPLTLRLKSLYANIKGSIAVLVTKNQEVIQLESLLKAEHIPCYTLQGKESFKIRDLVEMRLFTHFLKEANESSTFISNKTWEAIKVKFQQEIIASSSKSLVNLCIQQFEKEFAEKPMSEWLIFMQEVRSEDVIMAQQKKVLISTIHKAKGREFDQVFMLLNDYQARSEERIRALYVGITRAKSQLEIHTNTNDFYSYHAKVEQLTYHYDNQVYPFPERAVLHLYHKDVYLSFFNKDDVQRKIRKLQATDELALTQDGNGLYRSDAGNLVRFSKAFQQKLDTWIKKGYHCVHAEIQHIVFWYDESIEKEIRIILPKLLLEKRD